MIGVDNVASAVRDARQNARHNGVANAEFVAADAGDFMCALAAQKSGCTPAADAESATALAPAVDIAGTPVPAPDVPTPAGDLVLFMDPPRAGASEAFLDAACALAPERIVYISCNPETQVRDVARLARAGYEVRAVQPVDMFPHTSHIESIALIVRGKSKEASA